MKKVRVVNESDGLTDDLIEYGKETPVPTSSRAKQICFVSACVFSLVLCVLTVLLLIVIALMYGLIQSSVIPWGSNFCEIQFTVPSRNITSADLFSRYRKAFDEEPFNFGNTDGISFINGTVTTQAFKLIDDVLIRMNQDSTRIYITGSSRSRVGRWDFGSNRGHLELLIRKTETDRIGGYVGYTKINGCR